MLMPLDLENRLKHFYRAYIKCEKYIMEWWYTKNICG